MPLRASSHPGSPNSPSCSPLAWYSCWPGLSPWGESWKRTRVARTAALTHYRYATQPTMWCDVYVIMQYFVILDCTLLGNKLTTTTTTTMLCIAIIYININGMHCHKSYVWWIEQFVQQPFRCDSQYILRVLENTTPDAGLALVVPEPSCSITFLTEHIYVLDVKHCQCNESGSKLYQIIHGINGNINSKILKICSIAWGLLITKWYSHQNYVDKISCMNV